MAPFKVQGTLFCLLVAIVSANCAIVRTQAGEHRQSKAAPIFVKDDPTEPSQPEPIHRSRTGFDATSDAQNNPLKQNVYFSDPKINSPMGAQFESVPPNYLPPNYMANNIPRRNLAEDPSIASSNMAPNLAYPDSPNRQGNTQSGALNSYYQGLFSQMPLNKPLSQKPASEDSINDVFNNAFKKYNVKRYLMHKIFGNTHEADEDENGFFSNKHLKRHGTAGVAGKVLGELIGIKIRESIEGLGKSVSEYAKDFTARNFVNLGQVFSRVLKFQ